MPRRYHRVDRIRSFTDFRIVAVRIVAMTLAGIWRRLMLRTTFIAITGSVGKSTTKRCLISILESHYDITDTSATNAHFRGVVQALFLVRPWHRYAVIEIAIDGPGQMKWFGKTVRPDIAIWLGANGTHTASYRDIAHIAEEKSKLVDSLRPGGIAVLKNDDPYVRAYRSPTGVKEIRFGLEQPADVWASDVSARWPELLNFDVHHGADRQHITTKLVGAHWISSVLAAISASLQCGLTLADMVEPLSRAEPVIARLSAATLPNGAVFLRDEFNGSHDTYKAAMKVLEEAQSARKFLVISDISDWRQRPSRRAELIAEHAAESCDVVVFVGGSAEKGAARAVRQGMLPENARAFFSPTDAAAYLKAELRSGDLVLLRGRTTDKLTRLYLAQLQDVTCWRSTCNRTNLCDRCPEIARPVKAG